jgi:F-box protein, helicase, 18
MTTRTPTQEQAAILQTALRRGQVMVVNAIAGSGKTSTLEMYVDAYPNRRFLYLAFGKAQADEAKQRFGLNAECRTTHSLAFRETGAPYAQNKQKGLGNEPRGKAIMGPLDIRLPWMANLTIATVSRYLQSADAELSPDHLPEYAAYKPAEDQLVVLKKARRLWQKMCDKNDPSVPMSHDGYLKLWQLQCLESGKVPRIFYRYDAVLLDEAQDTNPAMEAILLQVVREGAHAVVLVGDERQSIYQWRGAVNMMERLSGAIEAGELDGVRRTLTESFRYGPRAAGVAAKILSLGREHKAALTGRGSDDPAAGGARCYLARTNAALIDEALAALAAHPEATLHFAGTSAAGRYDPTVPYKLHFIRSVYCYFARQPQLATDPSVRRFENWEDILQHATGGDETRDAATGDRELAAAVKFVEKYRFETPQVLDQIVSRSGPPERALASFSTAHRSKGLEWDHVTLLDDFIKLGSEIERNERGEVELPDEQELNLLYVAATRGRRWVRLNADLEEFVNQEFEGHFQALRPSCRAEREAARPESAARVEPTAPGARI